MPRVYQPIFSNDLTTGIFLIAVGQLGISASSTHVFNITSTLINALVPIVLPANPTTDLQAATKQYVDNVAQGLDVKESVRAATVVVAGYSLDGITLSNGNRILVKNQTTASKNGIYIVGNSGTAPVRAADFPSGTSTVKSGVFVFVEEDAANASSGWVLSTANPINVGTMTRDVFSDAFVDTWDITMNISGTNVLLRVQGASATSISWSGVIEQLCVCVVYV